MTIGRLVPLATVHLYMCTYMYIRTYVHVCMYVNHDRVTHMTRPIYMYM